MPAPLRLLALPWLVGLALGLGAPPARADNFPMPPNVGVRVDFWTRVYSEVGTTGGFVHDSSDLSLVYEVVRAPEGSSALTVQRQSDAAKQRVRSALLALASGRRSGLSDTERRVLAAHPPGVSSKTLRAAAERVRFQLGQADKFEAGLRRMGRWEGYIRRALRERGVPEDLVALPHVESSYNPGAASHAGAAGLWQFMRPTARLFMRVDHLVDERLDPYVASEGAARLLRGNYERLGTWPLAITAYNHGPGGLARAVRSLGTRDIGTIVARHQSPSFGFASRNFYAEFLAASRIDRDPVRYFGAIRKDAPAQPATVILAKSYGVGTLAKALGVPIDALREQNPALQRAVWNGSRSVPVSYALRVPARAGQPPPHTRVAGRAATLRFDATPRTIASVRGGEGGGARAGIHRVQPGETLSGIASRYAVNQQVLRAANGIPATSVIRAGQELVIPGRADPELAGERPGAPASTPRAQTGGGDGPTETHRVARGETLLEIGERYGVSMAQIAARNEIRDPADIREGQTLAIPLKRPPQTASAAPGSAPAPSPLAPAQAPTVAPTATPGGPGAAVATETTSLSNAPAAVPADALPAPQEERPLGAQAPMPALEERPLGAPAPASGEPAPVVPAAADLAPPTADSAPATADLAPAAAAPADAAGADGTTAPAELAEAPPADGNAGAGHVPVEPAFEPVRVEPGDTLGAIAARHGVEVAALAAANGIDDPRRLRPGQMLALPRGDGAPAAAPAPGDSAASGEREPAPVAPPAEPIRVTVAPGDTLGAIARRQGVDADALAAVNGIRDARSLRPGQLLELPAGAASEARPRGAAPVRTAAAAPPERVKVARGDTLSAIARRAGVDARALAAANGIRDPRTLRPGQVLELPAAGTASASAAATPRTYTVRSGDTLYSIAQRHGVTPAAIAARNGLRNRHKLSVGQRLELPPEEPAGRPG